MNFLRILNLLGLRRHNFRVVLHQLVLQTVVGGLKHFQFLVSRSGAKLLFFLSVH